jgi:hypothetical protein
MKYHMTYRHDSEDCLGDENEHEEKVRSLDNVADAL